jgi:feruloyl esterase
MDAPWYIAGPSQASYFDFIPDNVVYNTLHDMTLSLVGWVEEGEAPQYIVATGFSDNDNPVELALNRRICPYPQQAYWLGSDYGTGSYVQEDNWNCSSIY